MEIWKSVPGYEGLYRISNLGRVKSLSYKGTGREKIMKPGNNGGGNYLYINLYKDGEMKAFRIDKLVEQVFPTDIDTIENRTKGKRRAIICLTTKRIFKSIAEGALYYNIKSSSNICDNIRGKQEYSGTLENGTPLKWKYLNYSHEKTYRIKGECSLNKYELKTIQTIKNLVNNGNKLSKIDLKKLIDKLKREDAELQRLISILENRLNDEQTKIARKKELEYIILNGSTTEKLQALKEYEEIIKNEL